jgi:hypothetical protein
MAKRRGLVSVAELGAELAGAELGDARRSRRLGSIVSRIAALPDASFPELAGGESELEAIYRFMSNDEVKPEAILEPHARQSVARAGSEAVIVAHDTTVCRFEGDREGLGRLNVKDHGLWAHVALAQSASRDVFGVVGLKYGTREGPAKWRGSRRIAPEGTPSESARWPQLVDEVDERFGVGRAIHVMDREADWFELLEHLIAHKRRFVVRMAHDRRSSDGERVHDVLAGANAVAERDVQLAERGKGPGTNARATHPSRKVRRARLTISASRVEIISWRTKHQVSLNFVRVVELEPPEGCAPVLWTLMTTEPISTAEQVLAVVDAYRARWVIEELFKALKTGCSFEKRQLGSYAALLNALAVSLPVAAFLLRLRSTARDNPDAPAATVIDPTLLAILTVLARRPMPKAPTARDVAYAIAGLGGHLPRNGDPGWMTLGRGIEHLLEAARIVELLRTKM